MKRLGAWERPHPYVSALIDRTALAEALPAVLDALPLSLGDAYRGGFPLDASNAPPLLARPAGNDLAFFAVMYLQVAPDLLPVALEAHERVRRLLLDAGGKRYGPDWTGEIGQQDWREHLGDEYERWVKARRRFDPASVFTSMIIRSIEGDPNDGTQP
jgi:FAD/FMN-containing dehydrogenase